MLDNTIEDKLVSKLDEKLADVAKKEDLNKIKLKLEVVTNENLKLKKEIKDLTTRIEFIDRKTLASNIVVDGLKCADTHAAKTEFTKVCSDI